LTRAYVSRCPPSVNFDSPFRASASAAISVVNGHRLSGLGLDDLIGIPIPPWSRLPGWCLVHLGNTPLSRPTPSLMIPSPLPLSHRLRTRAARALRQVSLTSSTSSRFVSLNGSSQNQLPKARPPESSALKTADHSCGNGRASLFVSRCMERSSGFDEPSSATFSLLTHLFWS